MGRVIMSGIVPLLTVPVTKPKASLTPTAGVTYTDGISDLTPDVLSSYAEAVSNVTGVTNDTTAMYIDYGNIHRKISIADQITISLNGTDYAFDVIGFNHDDLTDSAAYGKVTVTGKAGLTLQMHNCFTTSHVMNTHNTNSGGWASSRMRTSMMVTIKEYLPTTWTIFTKKVNKDSGIGGGSSSGTEVTSDDCFLLAEIEIFGSIAYSVSGEGKQYAYYKMGKSKIKNRGSVGDVYWWQRSPQSGNTQYFCCVQSGGNAFAHGAGNQYSVSFAFCL